jgi:hypothetical protein
MHLLYADETNLDPQASDFFVYGALAIPSEMAFRLHAAVADLRSRYRVPPDFRFKFNPGPSHLTNDQFIALKQGAIEAAVASGCVLFTDVILHRIAKSPDIARRRAINRVLYHFDSYMGRVRQHGLVLIDRFSDPEIDAHLREKFAIGLTGMPYSNKLPLNRVVGLHYSAIGQSHFSSLIDIVLGSLRFAVNAHCSGNVNQLPTAKTLLRLIAPLLCGNDAQVCDLSLHFSPKAVRVPEYCVRYESLRRFIEGEIGR